MPLEASRLSTDEIKSLIKDNWEYNVTEIIHLSLGSAYCYLIDGEIRSFFKEFQSGFDISTVRREANLVDCLSDRGIPCAPFCRTNTGDAALCHRGQVLSLSRYIDGETVDYTNPLPKIYRQTEIQIEVAQMLNFAFRRTEICREFERNAGEISESLRKLV